MESHSQKNVYIDRINIGPLRKMDLNSANVSKESECIMYPNNYRLNIHIGDKMIGYAVWHQLDKEDYHQLIFSNPMAYWSGYCCVPEKWYYEITEGIIAPDNMPEITYTDKENNIIGWNHNHYCDLYNHTNLIGIISEIWNIWLLSNDYIKNKN